MSVHVNLQSIRQSLTSRVESPRFMLDEHQKYIRQLAVSIENISKPDTSLSVSDYDEPDWVLSKTVFNLQLDDGELVEYFAPSQQIHSRANSQNKFTQLFHQTPIALLYSGSKSEEDTGEVQKYWQLPLYSDNCKIKIQVFAIENAQDKFYLESQRPYLPSTVKIQLRRAELLSLIEEIRQQMRQSKLASSKVERKIKNLAIRKHQNYEIIANRVMDADGGEYNLGPLQNNQKYEHYRCRIEHTMKINKKYHQIQLNFILSVERLKECVGYMRAGFSKARDFGLSRRSLNRLVKESQYTKDQSNARSFNYDLDFSGGKSSAKLQKSKTQMAKVQNRNESFSLFACCSSNNNVYDNGQVIVNKDQPMGFDSGKEETRKRVQFRIGRCEDKNLFSFLDPYKPKNEKFYLFEKHYY